jgi:hypothetical protein
MWSNGVLLASVPMNQNHGTLLASFAMTSFNAGNSVTVSVLLDGKEVDLDPATADVTRTFTWLNTGANYIGLSARATAPAASFVKLDNLAIRKLPLGDSLASEYAMAAGLNAPTNAASADPDADGDSNLIEWLKGGQPGAADASRHLLWVEASPSSEFIFNHYRLENAAAAGVVYSFKCSTDLVNWTDFTPEEVSSQPDNPGYQLVQSRVPDAIAAGKTNLFILMESAGASQ